jgi:hypothetical protein
MGLRFEDEVAEYLEADYNEVSESKRTEKCKFENDVSDKLDDVEPKLLKLDATDRADTKK